MNNFLNKTIVVAIAVFVVACTQNKQQTEEGNENTAPPVANVSNEIDVLEDRSEKKNSRVRVQLKNKESNIPGDKPQLSTGATLEQVIVTARKSEQDLTSHPMSVSEAEASRVMKAQRPTADYYAVAPSIQSLDRLRRASEPVNRENYAHYEDNPLKRVAEHPVSTFSIDVDTGSYANVRRMLQSGHIPNQDAVRAEELINYFSYKYPVTAKRVSPFAMHKEIAPTPWNKDTHLLHIGIKGYDIDRQQLPASNLVFLIDVSGSMNSANKLGLLKSSLKLLTKQLDAKDSISIVVYAGASGVVLEPTPGNQQAKIISALDRLSAGGSTNGAAGIRLAYAMAEQAFIKNGINRVLLATDGDFNVGTVNTEQLKDLIEEKRKTGIALSTLGFGTGNYNDHLMEQIADVGNGNYAYIDTLNEAQKVLVDEMSSTMLTIAKDVKIQIEFNPAAVAEYRLIGYENRALRREDFNNDKVDAGEIGAGHTVTAIYEIALADSAGQGIEPLRYQAQQNNEVNPAEIAFLRLRYKAPESNASQLLEWPLKRSEIKASLTQTSNAFRFSAAVAAFAQQLRGGVNLGEFSYTDIMDLAKGARGEDAFGYRGEFLTMVNLAQSLSHPEQHAQLGN